MSALTPSRDRRVTRRRLGFAGVLVGTLLVAIAGPGTGRTPSSASALTVDGPTLTLDPSTITHPINPLIYGMNSYGVDQSLAAELKIPVERWGGDGTTRYNWEQDSSQLRRRLVLHERERGRRPDAQRRARCAGGDRTRPSGGTTDMTIPIIPWINKSSATNCSFPTSVYGAQQSVNPYVTLPGGAQCGNGLTPAGQTITDTDIAANNTANSPAFEAPGSSTWCQTFGTRPRRRRRHLPDGQRALGMEQHPPRRPPQPDRLGRAGRADRAVRRGGQVGRPDRRRRRPGRLRVGGLRRRRAAGRQPGQPRRPLWEAQYYLQQLALYQQQHGVRLLDYFDEHYYPTTPNGLTGCLALCEEGDAATQAARLQSTRSLWDPTYVENDWIGQYYGAIDLIPRMKSWVDQYYPGTKTAITEYNFGALDSMNGALAQADALGIFGAQGLDMADLWGPPTATQPGAFAFRMYRDYDGHGSTASGTTSVPAASSRPGPPSRSTGPSGARTGP